MVGAQASPEGSTASHDGGGLRSRAGWEVGGLVHRTGEVRLSQGTCAPLQPQCQGHAMPPPLQYLGWRLGPLGCFPRPLSLGLTFLPVAKGARGRARPGSSGGTQRQDGPSFAWLLHVTLWSLCPPSLFCLGCPAPSSGRSQRGPTLALLHTVSVVAPPSLQMQCCVWLPLTHGREAARHRDGL